MTAVREAFDRRAESYDRVFGSLDLRREVWDIADRLFQPGANILDLGCGTGEDALHFAARGVNVTAVDISPEMILKLQDKANGSVRFEIGDMRVYRPSYLLNGLLSNFGALNCVPELDWMSRLPLVPGGHLVLTVMGRFYPLEFVVSLLKGRPRIAFRRLRRSGEAVVEGVEFRVYYHSLQSMKRAFAPKFDLVAVKGLRSLSPTPHLSHLRRFAAIRMLEPADRWLCTHRPTATLADHFVSVWRRRET